MIKFSDIKITGADYSLVVVVFILIFIGLLAIYSASYHVESTVLKANFTRQIMWFLLSSVFMIAVIAAPIRTFHASAYGLYGLAIFLLVLALILNQEHVARWITIGVLRFQPAEFAKISVILALARYLSHERRNLNDVKEIAVAFGIVLLPFMLIARQPDLGTAFVLIAIILPVIFWAGLPSFYLFLLIAPFVVMVSSFNFYTYFTAMVLIVLAIFIFKPRFYMSIIIIAMNVVVGIVTPILWNNLHEYQQHRILTFLGLEMDPHGLSYQVIQSKVAIGSGGFWGKGLLQGTQTQLRFLPEQHTDFVFSVIGEELGFIGSLFVMTLFLMILLRGIYIAAKVRNKFAGLVVIGATATLSFHIIVNIGMTVGMMPVTGLPLPFLSYGGSFLVVSMVLIGFIINASIRRYKYK